MLTTQAVPHAALTSFAQGLFVSGSGQALVRIIFFTLADDGSSSGSSSRFKVIAGLASLHAVTLNFCITVFKCLTCARCAECH
jgi:hypothetical protein